MRTSSAIEPTAPRASSALRVALLALCVTMVACDRKPPLAPELAQIRCPVNRTEYARPRFVNAEITFVCISKYLADSPGMLRCDLTSHPMICEDVGTLVFTRGPDGEVYAGHGPKELLQLDPSEPDSYGGSRLIVNFHSGPPRTSTFEEEETDWRFLLPGSKDLLPSGFTFVKGALCDREATVLNSGGCNIEARSASLYWHISVYMLFEKGTPISAEEYREEMAFWMQYLGKMVIDPKA